MQLTTAKRSYELRSRLLGRHQVENLALAVIAAEELSALGFQRLLRSEIESGVASCFWPGRLERIELPGETTVLLDGAHNAHAAGALRDSLADSAGRWTLVFGVLEGKDVEEMLPLLAEIVVQVILTRPRGERGRSPESYRKLWQSMGHVQVVDDPAEALDRALRGRGAQIVVAGSLHLVGDLRRHLRSCFGRPSPAVGALFQGL